MLKYIKYSILNNKYSSHLKKIHSLNLLQNENGTFVSISASDHSFNIYRGKFLKGPFGRLAERVGIPDDLRYS